MAALTYNAAFAEEFASNASAGTVREVHNPHAFELGFGVTFADHDEAFTLVASYGYHFADHTSIGALAEYAFDPLDAWIVGVPLKYHAQASWVFTAMPGMELHNGHEEAVFRVGVGYELEIDGNSVTPEINATWIDEEIDFFVGLMFSF